MVGYRLAFSLFIIVLIVGRISCGILFFILFCDDRHNDDAFLIDVRNISQTDSDE